jgi:hypothetical protein
MTVAVTRVINACVLLDIDGDFVLTDQCFRNSVGTRFREPFGLRVEDLPRLTAIVVGHRAPRPLAAAIHHLAMLDSHHQRRSHLDRHPTTLNNRAISATDH